MRVCRYESGSISLRSKSHERLRIRRTLGLKATSALYSDSSGNTLMIEILHDLIYQHPRNYRSIIHIG